MRARTRPVGVLKSGMGMGVRGERETFNQIFRQLYFLRRESQTTDSNSFSFNQNSFALFLLFSFFCITMSNLGRTSGRILIFQPYWYLQEIVILLPRQAMTQTDTENDPKVNMYWSFDIWFDFFFQIFLLPHNIWLGFLFIMWSLNDMLFSRPVLKRSYVKLLLKNTKYFLYWILFCFREKHWKIPL